MFAKPTNGNDVKSNVIYPVGRSDAQQIDVVSENGALQPVAAQKQHFDGGRWLGGCVAAIQDPTY